MGASHKEGSAHDDAWILDEQIAVPTDDKGTIMNENGTSVTGQMVDDGDATVKPLKGLAPASGSPHFVYVCRLCKMEHYWGNNVADVSEAVDRLLHSILGIDKASGGKDAPPMLLFHQCGNGSMGVSDLVGFKMMDAKANAPSELPPPSAKKSSTAAYGG